MTAMKDARFPAVYLPLIALLSAGVITAVAISKRGGTRLPLFSASAAASPASKCPIEDPSFEFGPWRDGPHQDGPKEAGTEKSNYIYVFGAGSIVISDPSGYRIDLVKGTGDFTKLKHVTHSEIPYNHGYVFLFGVDETYEIKMQPRPDSRLWVQIIRGLDNVSPDELIRYHPLNLPPQAVARFRVSPQEIEPLRVDESGRGEAERVEEPAVAVGGEAADDLEGPEIGVATAAQGPNLLLTITAKDRAGVKGVFYNTERTGDPSSYLPYQGPVVVDPNRTPWIYIAAADKLWNYSVRKVMLKDQPEPHYPVMIDPHPESEPPICPLQK